MLTQAELPENLSRYGTHSHPRFAFRAANYRQS